MAPIDPCGRAGCFIRSFHYSVIWLMSLPPIQEPGLTLRRGKWCIYEGERTLRGCRLEKSEPLVGSGVPLHWFATVDRFRSWKAGQDLIESQTLQQTQSLKAFWPNSFCLVFDALFTFKDTTHAHTHTRTHAHKSYKMEIENICNLLSILIFIGEYFCHMFFFFNTVC